MVHLYIPGYSSANKSEQEKTSEYLKNNGIKTINYEWNHWYSDEGKDTWGIDYYVDDLIKHIADNHYGIICKSIGTYVTAALLNKMLWMPKYIILMGLPVNSFEDHHKEEFKILKKLEIPIHLIHNKNDPHGSWEDLKKFLNDVNYTNTVYDYGHHEYIYPEEILRLIENYR